MLCEMQSVSSRFWTRVAVSISYDNNHYTTGTNYNWYHFYIHVPKFFFSSLVRSRYLSLFLLFFCGQPERQSSLFGSFTSFPFLFFSFLVDYYLVLGAPFVSQNPPKFCVPYFHATFSHQFEQVSFPLKSTGLF